MQWPKVTLLISGGMGHCKLCRESRAGAWWGEGFRGESDGKPLALKILQFKKVKRGQKPINLL